MNSGGFCNQTDRVCDQSATEMWWPPSLPPSVSKFHLEIQLKVEAITLLEKQKKGSPKISIRIGDNWSQGREAPTGWGHRMRKWNNWLNMRHYSASPHPVYVYKVCSYNRASANVKCNSTCFSSRVALLLTVLEQKM